MNMNSKQRRKKKRFESGKQVEFKVRESGDVNGEQRLKEFLEKMKNRNAAS